VCGWLPTADRGFIQLILAAAANSS
jgi:hypothetical protein